MAAPIEMPFGSRTQVGPRNHVLEAGPVPPMGKGNFEGRKGRPIVKYRDSLQSSVQKMAEPTEMPFGFWARMGHRNRVRWGPVVLRDVAMAVATNFGTPFAITGFVRYNFGCMIPSDTLVDSRGGFSGSSYPMKT